MCKLVRLCHAEFDGMSRDECTSYMMSEIQGMITGYSDRGYTKKVYEIGQKGTKYYRNAACRHRFQTAYNIGRTTLTENFHRLKCGEKVHVPKIGPSTPSLDPRIANALSAMASKRGQHLTPSQIGMSSIIMHENT